MTVIGAVQEIGRGFKPSDRRLKAQEAHTRQRVRRLKAVANMVHSAVTLARPRSRNLRATCLLLDDSEDRLDQLLSLLVRVCGR